MKIVLAAPLYPPDIEESATYVKELARRLSVAYTVTVVAYGSIPEAVPGVRIIAVSKRRPILLRMIAFTFALLYESWSADVVYAENGSLVELPATLVALIRPLIMHTGDSRAYASAPKSAPRRLVQRLAYWSAHKAITDMPLQKPEILPFGPAPDFASYEASWEKHLTLLHSSFNHEH